MSTSQFHVQRISASDWISSDPHHGLPGMRDAIGEDVGWGFATPWIHRALASPHTHEGILEEPRPGASATDGPAAYWSSLLHLLVYRLGWMRPGQGLRWWYDSGKPVSDRTLRFISQVWDTDGQLDWFAAWLWSTAQVFDGAGEQVKEAIGYTPGKDWRLPDNDRWLQAQRSAADASGISAPVGHGGWDPHHLSAHIGGPLEPVSGAALLVRTGTEDRTAILLLDSMIGWYRALCAETHSLPELSGHSWRVEVVVKPVGWLGTYRKSARTGLWFCGRHSVHIRGT